MPVGGTTERKRAAESAALFHVFPLPERWSRVGARPPILFEDWQEQWNDPYGNSNPPDELYDEGDRYIYAGRWPGAHSRMKKGRGIRSPFHAFPLPERWSRVGAQLLASRILLAASLS